MRIPLQIPRKGAIIAERSSSGAASGAVALLWLAQMVAVKDRRPEYLLSLNESRPLDAHDCGETERLLLQVDKVNSSDLWLNLWNTLALVSVYHLHPACDLRCKHLQGGRGPCQHVGGFLGYGNGNQ